jgi:membrane-bound lytic murein transglycosylase D
MSLPFLLLLATYALRISFFTLIILGAGCQLNNTSLSQEIQPPRLVIHKVQERMPLPEGLRIPAGTAHGNDIWARVGQQFTLLSQVGRNSRIDQQLTWLLQNRSFLANASNRAGPYLHFIVEGLEQQNLPAELALLPIIESAYNPVAVSSQNAVGLWQFMPATARDFGLELTPSYDGRRDIIASTQAAMKYLTRLHKQFDHDWLLALAAYNAGEGTVSRLIEANRRRGLPTDYWHLSLPHETQEYVPRLLALSMLVGAPTGYGVNLQPISNEPYFMMVKLRHPVDLTQIARTSGITEKELERLNPAYIHGNTGNGPGHLLIPISKKHLLMAGLDALDESGEGSRASALSLEHTAVAAVPYE